MHLERDQPCQCILHYFMQMGSGRGQVPAPTRRLAALASTGSVEPGPSWECNLALGVWRAIADQGLSCENNFMVEAGIWEGCFIIGINVGGALVD